MAENSKIEWTDHTFNPWMGCTKISGACDNCYAEVQTARFKQVEWGPHADRRRTSADYWKQPLKWNRKAAAAGVRPRVFCASLADVFDNHKSIEPEWRADLWVLIKATPNLDWLLLTKRPQNIHRFIPNDWGDGYPNVWLGTTVENQVEARTRIPHLVSTPAKVRFLSCEPLLGPLDLRSVEEPSPFGRQFYRLDAGEIHWVICGGESAPDSKRRDMKLSWAKSLADQCIQAGVPFLFKQHSGRNQKAIKAKGRDLGGIMWDQYPEVAA